MIAGRERDGVFITEDCVHLVECTISRTKVKAKQDLGASISTRSTDHRTQIGP